LFIRQIPVGLNRTNCYLISPDKNRGLVIDPGAEGEKILRIIEQTGLKIEQIIITHGHFDHIEAVDELREKTGAPVSIHILEQDFLTDPEKNLSCLLGSRVKVSAADTLLKEGDEIVLDGQQIFEVWHTPGHSPGSISLYNSQEGIIFSGDLVFSRGIGRADFAGCCQEELYSSIEERILTLPINTMIYPGHGIKTTIKEFKDYWGDYWGS
jgi:hydroxyacylglutathione hydrolase